MHAASWRTAEKFLKSASDWIFVGYSMPAADFEFKYLLKRVQLGQLARPRITVISGAVVPMQPLQDSRNSSGMWTESAPISKEAWIHPL
jgi:hypothetical protein